MSDSTNPKDITEPVQGVEDSAPPTGYATVTERRFDGSFISGAGNDIFYFNDSFVYGVGDVEGNDFYVIGQYQIGNINLNDVTGDNRVYFDDDFVINYARISGQGLILGYDNGIGGYSELRVRDANTRYKFYLGNSNNDADLTVTELIARVGVTHAPVGTPTKTLTAGGVFELEDTSLITASTDFGVTLLGGIGLDVFTLGFSQNGTLNGRAGADYYYLTRFQESTSLNLRDTEGKNHFIVEAGVAIADVDDSGEAIILDLANGGEIRIAGGLTKYSFHIGDFGQGTVSGTEFLNAYKDGVGLTLNLSNLTFPKQSGDVKGTDANNDILDASALTTDSWANFGTDDWMIDGRTIASGRAVSDVLDENLPDITATFTLSGDEGVEGYTGGTEIDRIRLGNRSLTIDGGGENDAVHVDAGTYTITGSGNSFNLGTGTVSHSISNVELVIGSAGVEFFDLSGAVFANFNGFKIVGEGDEDFLALASGNYTIASITTNDTITSGTDILNVQNVETLTLADTADTVTLNAGTKFKEIDGGTGNVTDSLEVATSGNWAISTTNITKGTSSYKNFEAFKTGSSDDSFTINEVNVTLAISSSGGNNTLTLADENYNYSATGGFTSADGTLITDLSGINIFNATTTDKTLTLNQLDNNTNSFAGFDTVAFSPAITATLTHDTSNFKLAGASDGATFTANDLVLSAVNDTLTLSTTASINIDGGVGTDSLEITNGKNAFTISSGSISDGTNTYTNFASFKSDATDGNFTLGTVGVILDISAAAGTGALTLAGENYTYSVATGLTSDQNAMITNLAGINRIIDGNDTSLTLAALDNSTRVFEGFGTVAFTSSITATLTHDTNHFKLAGDSEGVTFTASDLVLSGGDDTLTLSTTENISIDGGGGTKDTLIGTTVNLSAHTGFENAEGTDETNIIRGDAGNNILTGKGGDDTFVISEGSDTIADFKVGANVLDFGQVGVAGLANLTFSEASNAITVTFTINSAVNTTTLQDVSSLIDAIELETGTTFNDKAQEYFKRDGTGEDQINIAALRNFGVTITGDSGAGALDLLYITSAGTYDINFADNAWTSAPQNTAVAGSSARNNAGTVGDMTSIEGVRVSGTVNSVENIRIDNDESYFIDAGEGDDSVYLSVAGTYTITGEKNNINLESGGRVHTIRNVEFLRGGAGAQSFDLSRSDTITDFSGFNIYGGADDDSLILATGTYAIAKSGTVDTVTSGENSLNISTIETLTLSNGNNNMITAVADINIDKIEGGGGVLVIADNTASQINVDNGTLTQDGKTLNFSGFASITGGGGADTITVGTTAATFKGGVGDDEVRVGAGSYIIEGELNSFTLNDGSVSHDISDVKAIRGGDTVESFDLSSDTIADFNGFFIDGGDSDGVVADDSLILAVGNYTIAKSGTVDRNDTITSGANTLTIASIETLTLSDGNSIITTGVDINIEKIEGGGGTLVVADNTSVRINLEDEEFIQDGKTIAVSGFESFTFGSANDILGGAGFTGHDVTADGGTADDGSDNDIFGTGGGTWTIAGTSTNLTISSDSLSVTHTLQNFETINGTGETNDNFMMENIITGIKIEAQGGTDILTITGGGEHVIIPSSYKGFTTATFTANDAIVTTTANSHIENILAGEGTQGLVLGNNNDVEIDLTKSTDNLTQGANSITISGFENFTGGDGMDTITLATGNWTINISSADDFTINNDSQTHRIKNIEQVMLSAGTADVLDASSGSYDLRDGDINGVKISGFETLTLGDEGNMITLNTSSTQFDTIDLGDGTNAIIVDSTETVDVTIDIPSNSYDIGAASGRISGTINSVTGAGGDDVLTARNDATTLNGAGGDDTLNGGGNVDRLNGGAGEDELSGDSGNDFLNGGADDDTLDGEAGDDELTGDTGKDTFVISEGTDTITDFKASEMDLLNFGQTGIDDVSNLTFSTVSNTITIAYGDDGYQVILQNASDVIDDINGTAGSGFQAKAENYFRANSDLLSFGKVLTLANATEQGVIKGDANGFDILDVSSSTVSNTVNFNNNNVTIDDNNYRLEDVNGYRGGKADDVITLDRDNRNVIDGGTGDSTTTGNDTIIVNNGDWTIDGTATAFTISNDTVNTSVTHSISNVEVVEGETAGEVHNFKINAIYASFTIRGNTGTADSLEITSQVVAGLGTANMVASMKVEDIETLTLSSSADSIIVGVNTNFKEINGGGGADTFTIDGNVATHTNLRTASNSHNNGSTYTISGFETFNGGSGVDNLYLDSNTSATIFDGKVGSDVVHVAGDWTFSGSDGNFMAKSNDSGSASHNLKGFDSITGSSGSDTFAFSSFLKVNILADGANDNGTDILQLNFAGSFDLTKSEELSRNSGSDKISMAGNTIETLRLADAGGNMITVGKNFNTFETINFGNGANNALLISGDDVATVDLSAGTWTIGSANSAIAGRVTNVDGGGGDDALKAGSGGVSFDGKAGKDTLTGGAGNDTFTGGIGDDTLTGGGGNDKLFGGADKDTLNGGVGDDEMTGGAGDDIFTITGGGADTIKDFGIDATNANTGKDLLDFGQSGVSALSSLTFSTSVNNIIITYGSSNSLTLEDQATLIGNIGSGNFNTLAQNYFRDNGLLNIVNAIPLPMPFAGGEIKGLPERFDVFDASASSTENTINLNSQTGRIDGTTHSYTLPSVEGYYGGTGSDTVYLSNSQDNIVRGGVGADIVKIFAAAGANWSIAGEAGDFTFGNGTRNHVIETVETISGDAGVNYTFTIDGIYQGFTINANTGNDSLEITSQETVSLIVASRIGGMGVTGVETLTLSATGSTVNTDEDTNFKVLNAAGATINSTTNNFAELATVNLNGTWTLNLSDDLTLTQNTVDDLTESGDVISFTGSHTIYQSRGDDPVTNLGNLSFANTIDFAINDGGDNGGTDFALTKENFHLFNKNSGTSLPTLTSHVLAYGFQSGAGVDDGVVGAVKSDQPVSFTITGSNSSSYTISDNGVITYTGTPFASAVGDQVVMVEAKSKATELTATHNFTFNVRDTSAFDTVISSSSTDELEISASKTYNIDGGASNDVIVYTTAVSDSFFPGGSSSFVAENVEYVALSDGHDEVEIFGDLPYIMVGGKGNDTFTINGFKKVTLWGDKYRTTSSTDTKLTDLAGEDTLVITGADNPDNTLRTDSYGGRPLNAYDQSVLEDGWRAVDRTTGTVNTTTLNYDKNDFGLILAQHAGTSTAINIYKEARPTVTQAFDSATKATTLRSKITGAADGFGRQVALADFNGDGDLDLIITSPNNDNALTVIYNDRDTTGDPMGDDFDGDPFNTAANRFTLKGSPSASAFPASSSFSGYASQVIGHHITPKNLTVGDINGDGFDDIIISDGLGFAEEPNRKLDNTRFDIIFGRQAQIPSNTAANIQFASKLFSISTSSLEIAVLGDINGDNIDDFAFVENTNERKNAILRIVYGDTDLGTTVKSNSGDQENADGKNYPIRTDDVPKGYVANGTNLASNSAFDTSAHTISNTTQGSTNNVRSIQIKPLGDINGDEIDDFAVTNALTGVIYVVYGIDTDKEGETRTTADIGKVGSSSDISRTFLAENYGGSAGFAIIGRNGHLANGATASHAIPDPIGIGLTGLGDFNGDGINDFAFTETRANGRTGAAGTTVVPSTASTDAIYIVFGRDTDKMGATDDDKFAGTYTLGKSEDDGGLLANGVAARITHELLPTDFNSRSITTGRTHNFNHTLSGLGNIDGDTTEDGKELHDLGFRTSDGELHIIYGHDIKGGGGIATVPAEEADNSNADQVSYHNLEGAVIVASNDGELRVIHDGKINDSLGIEKIAFTGIANQTISVLNLGVDIDAGDGDDTFVSTTTTDNRQQLQNLDKLTGGEGYDTIRYGHNSFQGVATPISYDLKEDFEHITFFEPMTFAINQSSDHRVRLHHTTNQTVEIEGREGQATIIAFDKDFNDSSKGAHTFIFGNNTNAELGGRGEDLARAGAPSAIEYRAFTMEGSNAIDNTKLDKDDKIELNFKGDLTYTLSNDGTRLSVAGLDSEANAIRHGAIPAGTNVTLLHLDIKAINYDSNDFDASIGALTPDAADFNFVNIFNINNTNSRVYDGAGNKIVFNTLSSSNNGTLIRTVTLGESAPPQENPFAITHYQVELQNENGVWELDALWHGETFTFEDGDRFSFTEDGNRISEPDFVQALEEQNIIAEFANGNTILEFADNKSITFAKDYSASDKNQDGLVGHDEIQEFVDALANTHLEFA